MSDQLVEIKLHIAGMPEKDRVAVATYADVIRRITHENPHGAVALALVGQELVDAVG